MEYRGQYAHFDQQNVQATYDPSQPSQPYDPSSTAVPAAAAQSSSYYYYDPQQYATYYHSHDYANYYYQQQPPEAETHQLQHSQNAQFYQESYFPSHQDPYYPQAAQNPISDPRASGVSASAHDVVPHPMVQYESRGRGGKRGFRNRCAQEGPTTGQAPVTAGSRTPKMSWCELCRVDCNTPEILEQHRNGKRHKKNLRVNEELQNLKKQMTEPVKAAENLPAENKPNDVNAQGAGLKRKMKGGGGGKFLKTDAGTRRPAGPVQPKEQFICELCNVKCEAQVVFDTHLAGKKHLANVKRLEKNQPLCGQVQVMAPPSASSNLPFTSTPVSMDVNSQSSGPEPLALLSFNGVSSSDPQVLLAEIIMNYVRSQTQGLPPQGQELLPDLSSGTPNQEYALQISALPPATGHETGIMTEASRGEAVPGGAV